MDDDARLNPFRYANVRRRHTLSSMIDTGADFPFRTFQEPMLPDHDSQAQARVFIVSIQEMLVFAEQREDFLLAAKLEDVRLTLMEHHAEDGT